MRTRIHLVDGAIEEVDAPLREVVAHLELVQQGGFLIDWGEAPLWAINPAHIVRLAVL